MSMISRRLNGHVLLWFSALSSLAGAAGSARGEFVVSLDPRGTYLRVSGESPPAAAPVDLLALGIQPGDTITLTRVGDFQRGGDAPFDEDVFLDTTAVFSASSMLGPASDLHRVVGALAAGADFMTVPTFVGELPTDIPEDFEVSNFDGTMTSATVVVPAGARFLFVAAADSFFSDNADPDGDFGVRITVEARAIPEPSSLLLALLGVLSTAGLLRHRRRG
jgi:hypothetical protein